MLILEVEQLFTSKDEGNYSFKFSKVYLWICGIAVSSRTNQGKICCRFSAELLIFTSFGHKTVDSTIIVQLRFPSLDAFSYKLIIVGCKTDFQESNLRLLISLDFKLGKDKRKSSVALWLNVASKLGKKIKLGLIFKTTKRKLSISSFFLIVSS